MFLGAPRSRWFGAAPKAAATMESCKVRNAEPSEQRELTRLVVRATLHAGHDAAFIDRAMPALTVTLPLITAGAVRIGEGPFYFSPDVVLPQLLYIVPRES
jgi:hypothetical protein